MSNQQFKSLTIQAQNALDRQIQSQNKQQQQYQQQHYNNNISIQDQQQQQGQQSVRIPITQINNSHISVDNKGLILKYQDLEKKLKLAENKNVNLQNDFQDALQTINEQEKKIWDLMEENQDLRGQNDLLQQELTQHIMLKQSMQQNQFQDEKLVQHYNQLLKEKDIQIKEWMEKAQNIESRLNNSSYRKIQVDLDSPIKNNSWVQKYKDLVDQSQEIEQKLVEQLKRISEQSHSYQRYGSEQNLRVIDLEKQLEDYKQICQEWQEKCEMIEEILRQRQLGLKVLEMDEQKQKQNQNQTKERLDEQVIDKVIEAQKLNQQLREKNQKLNEQIEQLNYQKSQSIFQLEELKRKVIEMSREKGSEVKMEIIEMGSRLKEKERELDLQIKKYNSQEIYYKKKLEDQQKYYEKIHKEQIQREIKSIQIELEAKIFYLQNQNMLLEREKNHWNDKFIQLTEEIQTNLDKKNQEIEQLQEYNQKIKSKLQTERQEINQTFEMERKVLEEQLTQLKNKNKDYQSQLQGLKQLNEISELKNKQRVQEIESIVKKSFNESSQSEIFPLQNIQNSPNSQSNLQIYNQNKSIHNNDSISSGKISSSNYSSNKKQKKNSFNEEQQ